MAMMVGGTREEPGSGAQGEDRELMGTNGFGDRGGVAATITQSGTRVPEDGGGASGTKGRGGAGEKVQECSGRFSRDV